MNQKDICIVKRATNSAIVLGNAAELIANVISNIAGNDISNSINNNSITKDMIKSLVITKFNNNISRIK